MAMKENKMITLWMCVVALTWLCWSSSCVCSSATNCDRINFNLRDSHAFTDFINKLRGSLKKYGDDRSHNIRILSSASSLDKSQRFVIVQLKNWEQTSVELAIDVSSVNIVGYLAGDKSYFFSDAPAEALNNVFKGTDERKLAFGSTYSDLERIAGIESRKNTIFIGESYLHHAIDSLYNTESTPQNTLAEHLIVIIQMVSEAARFNVIEFRVRQSFDSDYLTDETMLTLENNWAPLSRAVQESTDGGVFPTEILLRTTYGSRYLVGNVADLKNALALMLFVCRRLPSTFSPFIRSVVPDIDNDVVCQIPEPTIRISGRNGLCVDVRDGKYNNGNPIQLAPCDFKTM
eukprot:XP_015582716.1 ricin-like [Ricinus communis]